MKGSPLNYSEPYKTSTENERVVSNKKRDSCPAIAKHRVTPAVALESTATGDRPGAASTPLATKKKKKAVLTSIGDVTSETSPLETSIDILCHNANDKPKKRNKSVNLAEGDVEINSKKSKQSIETDSELSQHGFGSIKLEGKNKHKKRTKNVEENVKENLDLPEKPKKKKKKNPAHKEIEQDLENLSFGQNASSLADMLDEVRLVDRNRKKKQKKADQRGETVKKPKNEVESQDSDPAAHSVQDDVAIKKKKRQNKSKQEQKETSDVAETENVKEKVKWIKRKWNKDRRSAGDTFTEHWSSSVLVEQLPLSLLFSYKKILPQHFAKCGPIKKIGIAETYPAVEPRPVFTTTLQFCNEGAAEQALEEDNMEVSGWRVRVRRALPPAHTTVAVRCYAGCSAHLLSSIFAPCGRVRCIREIQKGKSSMPTAFVEFDGPAGVEKALKVAAEARIGGKKVLVNKFEDRKRKAEKQQDDDSPS